MNDQSSNSTTQFSEPDGVLPPVQQPAITQVPPTTSMPEPILMGDGGVPMSTPAAPLPPAPVPPPMQLTTTGQPLPPVTVAPDSPQTMPDSRALVATPEEAADGDLIEKEWVVKAKQIVEHTIEDPFKQQNELNKVRGQYMKKRYNRDIGTE